MSRPPAESEPPAGGAPEDDADGGRAGDALPRESEPAPAATVAGATARAGVRRSPAAALLVAMGILLTRLFGLVRSRVTATYLGTSDAADVFTAATRIPNFLQNLFGEGVLSASFIPVYARLLAEGRREESDRVAGSVFGLLAATVALLVAVGVLATPLVVDTVASGFDGEKRELTIRLVRILFPGTGLLVLFAWCLGILNSHGRFFLSYVAPVVWNLAIVGALLWGGVRGVPPDLLVEQVAWAVVLGSVLQVGVLLPSAIGVLGAFRPSLGRASAHVREVVRNFVPAFVARGAVQISAYVDLGYASHLGTGAQAALGYAQAIYLLPVSLFGMSVAAAALPAMSGSTGSPEAIHAALRARLGRDLRQVAYFVVPSAAAFVAVGDLVAGVILQSGAFTRETSIYVWAILAASAPGLLVATVGRLYSSAFYALQDTRTPLRYSLVRIVLSVTLGWLAAFPLPRVLGIDRGWGVAGLTLASGVAGMVEYGLLRRGLQRRIGAVGLPTRFLLALWGSAALAAGIGWLARGRVGGLDVLVSGSAVLAAFAITYLVATIALGVPEARTVLGRVAARLPGTSRGRRSGSA